jgi:glycosyltransferase involved in cell wall biosynthesis
VSDVTDYLLAADLFVLPSSTEGMSNALLEAMAVGLPIVATRVPGNCELIRDEDSGLLVEPKDPQALAQAIIRLLSSPEQAARLGQAARETAASRFAIQRIGQDYLALYAELLSQTSNGRPS